MLNRYAIGISLLAILGWGAPRAGAAAKEQRQIKWEGLSALVGQKVRVVMPDGSQIEGKATKLEADALAVEIGKTSNKMAYPKGPFLVPRATLKTLDVSHRTKQWRIICTAAGGALGLLFGTKLVLGSNLFAKQPHQGEELAALVIGMPVLGYALGNAADRRTITYVIAP